MEVSVLIYLMLGHATQILSMVSLKSQPNHMALQSLFVKRVFIGVHLFVLLPLQADLVQWTISHSEQAAVQLLVNMTYL